MHKRHLFATLLGAALVVVFLSLNGFGGAAVQAQAQNTPRPTRDRTTNPRPTRENTARPTRDRTTNPRATRTPTKRPTRDRTTNPRRTRTSEPTVTGEASVTPAAPLATETPDVAKQAGNAIGALTSELLVVNTDGSRAAKVSVNVYDQQGAVVYSDSFKIKKNGAQVFKLPNSVGSNFMGSARVVSNRRIQALVLDANNPGTASDAYEVSGIRSNTVTLPLVRHGTLMLDTNGTGGLTGDGSGESEVEGDLAAQHTLIAIQNTSGSSAEATFSTYSSIGVELATEPLTIPPGASVYLDTNDLFGDTPFQGSARITASQSIAAAAITSYKQDTASLRGMTVQDQSKNVVVPKIDRKRNKNGKVTAWTEMYVLNTGSAATNLTIKFFNKAGKLKETLKRNNVPAGGVAILDLQGSEFNSLGKKFGGWAVVASSNNAPLAVHSLAAHAGGKQLIGIGGVARERINGRGVCAQVSTRGDQRSTLNILNTHAKKAAQVRARFFAQADGALIKSFEMKIEPRSQRVLTAKSGLPPNFQGMVIMNTFGRSPAAMVGTVTTQTLNGKRVSSVSGYACR